MFWFDNEQESKELFNLKAKNVTIAVAAKDSNWNLRSFQSKSKKIIFGKTKGAYDYANNYVELENGNMSMLVKRSTGNRFMKLLGNRIFHLLSVILMLMISYIRWIMNYINWRQIMIV